MVCGIRDPVVLNNHHTNPATKKMTIGRILHGGFSLAVLREELAKTVPVCLNCHSRIHHAFRAGKIGSLDPSEWSVGERRYMEGSHGERTHSVGT